MAAEILVVDDDPDIIQLVTIWLTDVGYSVYTARNGVQGLNEFISRRPDLVIVDVMMPRMDGLELCRQIREISSVPIIVLSAKTQEEDKVLGLSFGADDYITKPAPRREFLARVEAALRRASMPAIADSRAIYTDGYLTVDFDRHEVFAEKQQVHLTPLEFFLLKMLVENAGKVLSHQVLLDAGWGQDYSSADSVKWHIVHLRRKIGDDTRSPRIIRTVRGAGYRYDPPVASPSTPGTRQQGAQP